MQLCHTNSFGIREGIVLIIPGLLSEESNRDSSSIKLCKPRSRVMAGMARYKSLKGQPYPYLKHASVSQKQFFSQQ